MSSNSSSSTTSDSESDTGSLRLPSSLPLPGKRESNLEEWEIQAPKNEFVSDSKDAGKSLGQGRAAVQPRRYTCQDCGMVFANRTALDEHVKGSHPAPPPPKAANQNGLQANIIYTRRYRGPKSIRFELWLKGFKGINGRDNNKKEANI